MVELGQTRWVKVLFLFRVCLSLGPEGEALRTVASLRLWPRGHH